MTIHSQGLDGATIIPPMPSGTRVVQCGPSLYIRTLPTLDDPNPRRTRDDELEAVALARAKGWVSPCGAPSPRYNCVGLVVASRRGWLTDASLDGPSKLEFGYIDQLGRIVEQALTADGYAHTLESPRPGDVAEYGYNGSVSHVGLVVGSRVSLVGTIPLVWSKWGALGEFVHEVGAVPSSCGRIERYWRLRSQ